MARTDVIGRSQLWGRHAQRGAVRAQLVVVLAATLSRLSSASRLIRVFLACAACLLASVATANAADITISYSPPTGHTGAEREGTSRYQGNDATETDVTVALWSVSPVNDKGLICNPGSGLESEQCDVYDVFSGSYEAIAPCEPYGLGDVLCPDAEYFTATLGGGTNDSYVLDAPLQYQSATVTAGNGGDFIEGTDPPEYKGEFPDEDIFTGGTGNDRLVGGPGNDIIRGGPGEDIIDGRGGEDQLYGEGGNDQITGGPTGKSLEAGGEGTNKLGVVFNPEAPDWDSYDGGNETFDGEGGISTVSFYHAPGPVTANVNGLADSGVAGQQDTIEENIAEVDGSENDDTLTAGKAPVTLDGEGGNDTIYGGPGGDTLIGGGGNDTIHTVGPAGVGPDSIYASGTGCSIYVSCPTGNTTIYANDGIQDQISCGPGADIVYADALDVVSTSPIFACPTVYRSATSGNPGSGSSNPGGTVAGTSSIAQAATKGNSASLKIVCAGAATSACVDSLTLSVVETLRSGKVIAVAAKSKTKKRTVTLGHASVTLSGGQSKTVAVPLNGTGRALLAHEHKLHVELAVMQTSAGKTFPVKALTLTFTAPKHR
jgi:Ca2+-binding RTX toxin-like protein